MATVQPLVPPQSNGRLAAVNESFAFVVGAADRLYQVEHLATLRVICRQANEEYIGVRGPAIVRKHQDVANHDVRCACGIQRLDECHGLIRDENRLVARGLGLGLARSHSSASGPCS